MDGSNVFTVNELENKKFTACVHDPIPWLLEKKTKKDGLVKQFASDGHEIFTEWYQIEIKYSAGSDANLRMTGNVIFVIFFLPDLCLFCFLRKVKALIIFKYFSKVVTSHENELTFISK